MNFQTVSQRKALSARPKRLKTLQRMVSDFLKDARDKIARAAKYEVENFTERRKR